MPAPLERSVNGVRQVAKLAYNCDKFGNLSYFLRYALDNPKGIRKKCQGALGSEIPQISISVHSQAMNFNTGFTFVECLLFLILGILFVWIITLEWRFLRATRTLRILFKGRTGVDLEQMLRAYLQRVDHTDQALAEMVSRTAELERKAPTNVQHVGVIRFNPFPDKGGDQSFAVALLDDRADGVVFTGLHSRGDSRIYAKPVVGGNSTYALTEEEKEAISRALGKSQVTPTSPPPFSSR